MINITKKEYSEEIKLINQRISIALKVDDLNTKLNRSNWVFLHPFSQGMDIGILQNMLDKNENTEYEILKFFARKFLDLRNTIHFIEGFFPTRPYIKDYILPIKESVILCLQKDFRGAICILIPVIEGVLRKCLIDKCGENKKAETSIKELIKSLDKLTLDFIELKKKCLKKQFDHLVKAEAYFDNHQEKNILSKYKEWFTIWTNQFKNYLSNNLYLDTRKNELTDSFNRHVIFHSLEDDIDFTFGNYLKLYHSLIYLTWAIGNVNEECTVLSVASEHHVQKEYANYLNVLFVSEAMTDIKNEIYRSDEASFKDFLSPDYINILNMPVEVINSALSLTDFLKS